nr:benzoate carboxyl methyltransferase-like [Tanacetum cinerariifolium]
MNAGDGESSYANNSMLQNIAIRNSLPILKHAIKRVCDTDVIYGKCLKIADLGCSSSNNTLLVASYIIDIVDEVCKANKCKAPQFQVCLNDLFGNDFNNIFRMLPGFYAKLAKEKGDIFGRCFVSAVPGSFYGRLFPDNSIHLVHSSYSIHWLSQVPEGLDDNGLNIYMAKTSPHNVLEAYENQFRTDFTKFLQLRSEEIVCGGCMVLTFVGRGSVDPTSDDCCSILELLAKSLHDMLKEGVVQESDLRSFNVPVYHPCEDEVRNVIQGEGSFSLDDLYVFKTNWDPQDTDYVDMKDLNEPSRKHGESTAKVMKAVLEPMLTSHFGNSIIDLLFRKYEKHVADHLAKTKTRYHNIVISLSKK